MVIISTFGEDGEDVGHMIRNGINGRTIPGARRIMTFGNNCMLLTYAQNVDVLGIDQNFKVFKHYLKVCSNLTLNDIYTHNMIDVDISFWL